MKMQFSNYIKTKQTLDKNILLILGKLYNHIARIVLKNNWYKINIVLQQNVFNWKYSNSKFDLVNFYRFPINSGFPYSVVKSQWIF